MRQTARNTVKTVVNSIEEEAATGRSNACVWYRSQASMNGFALPLKREPPRARRGAVKWRIYMLRRNCVSAVPIWLNVVGISVEDVSRKNLLLSLAQF